MVETLNMDSTLKKRVLDAFSSRTMRDYLDAHFEKLHRATIIEIVVGSLMPLQQKAALLADLARQYPSRQQEANSFSDFEPYAQLYCHAQVEISTPLPEHGIYLLTRFWGRMAGRMEEGIPFLSFEQAAHYITAETGDWLDTDHLDDSLCWFEIEKWIPDEKNRLRQTWTFLVLPDGTVTGAVESDLSGENNQLHHNIYGNAMFLNTPVPFSPGDVVTIDCRPFAPLKHGVITDIGDNWDCCCVQCFHLTDTGEMRIDALKHTEFFDHDSLCSCLYKLDYAQAPLPEQENYFFDLGRLIKEYSANAVQSGQYDGSDIYRMMQESRDYTTLMEKIAGSLPT